jgi:hypothetical protein
MLLDIAVVVLVFICIILGFIFIHLFKALDSMHCQILKSDLKITACLDEQRKRNNGIIKGHSDE